MSSSDLDVEDDPKLEDKPEDPPKEGGDEGKPEAEDQKPDEPMMPVAAHVAERRELQYRLEVAEDKVRTATRPEPPKPEDPVDWIAEPEKIIPFIDQRVRQGMEALSKKYAVRQHGREVVDKAYTALANHATTAEQQVIGASADPWGDAVEWHQRRIAMDEIGDDPAAWRKATRESIKKDLLAEATVSQAKGIAPAPSLADEPDLGTRADKSEKPMPTMAEMLDD